MNEGKGLTEVLRQLEIAESSWNRWRNQYGGMKADGAKRLKELRSENARLKKLLAEADEDEKLRRRLRRLVPPAPAPGLAQNPRGGPP